MYFGESSRASQHFERNGHKCPEGYNIADYLIDVTVDAAGDARGADASGSVPPDGSDEDSQVEDDSDDERAPRRYGLGRKRQAGGAMGGIKDKAARLLGAFTGSNNPSGSGAQTPRAIPQKLASLVLENRASDDAKIVEAEIARIQRGTTPDGIDRVQPSVVADGTGRDRRDVHELRGYRKATWGRQFVLLSGRAFKNLYRCVMPRFDRSRMNETDEQ